MKKEKDEQQIQPYKYDKLARIPSVYKILFLKWWASGATFFFTYAVVGVADLDKLVLMWLIYGLVQEYVVNKIIIWMKNSKDDTTRFLPYRFERKKMVNILASLVYSGVMIYLIFVLQEHVFKSYSLDRIFFPESYGIGPIMFATLFIILDGLWIMLLNVITKTKK